VIRIRNWIAACVIFLVAAAIVSGCLGVKTPSVSRATPPAILVDYLRTGGVARLDERLVIFDNGDAVFSGKDVNREIQINQTELETLSNLFDKAQFSMLENNYTSHRYGADFIHYIISYHGKIVYTEDSAVPPALQPVIDELNRIILTGQEQELGARQFANPYT